MDKKQKRMVMIGSGEHKCFYVNVTWKQKQLSGTRTAECIRRSINHQPALINSLHQCCYSNWPTHALQERVRPELFLTEKLFYFTSSKQSYCFKNWYATMKNYSLICLLDFLSPTCWFVLVMWIVSSSRGDRAGNSYSLAYWSRWEVQTPRHMEYPQYCLYGCTERWITHDIK